MFGIDISKLTVDEIIMYLRKSRKDMDYGKDEPIEVTLQRHEKRLQEWALTNLGSKIPEKNIYREVVSGDTIADRPKIQEVMKKVESPNIKAVMVVDTERLGRGDSIDQGRIVQTFQYTNTLIITPTKIFNLEDENDRSFFEEGLHQARRYLEYIKKVLRNGREASVKEGKYVGSSCPYGYTKEKLKNEKGYKLVPLEEEAKFVKIIFQKAVEGMGSQNIAHHLNSLGSKPRKSNEWSYSSIQDILSNPTYYGMLRWNWRKTKKTMVNGEIKTSNPINDNYILVKGLHEPLVDKDTWELALKNSRKKRGKSIPHGMPTKNPLMGLVKCEVCGRYMQRRSYNTGYPQGLICSRPRCENIGSNLLLVEERVIQSLRDTLINYKQIVKDFNFDNKKEIAINKDTLNIITNEINNLTKQLNNVYDFLEQGLYDNETFLERSTKLKKKIASLEKEKKKYTFTPKSKQEKIRDIIPNIEKVLKNYNYDLSPQERNDLLKEVIDYITYIKFKRGKGHEDEFTLKIKIKL